MGGESIEDNSRQGSSNISSKTAIQKDIFRDWNLKVKKIVKRFDLYKTNLLCILPERLHLSNVAISLPNIWDKIAFIVMKYWPNIGVLTFFFKKLARNI